MHGRENQRTTDSEQAQDGEVRPGTQCVRSRNEPDIRFQKVPGRGADEHRRGGEAATPGQHADIACRDRQRIVNGPSLILKVAADLAGKKRSADDAQ